MQSSTVMNQYADRAVELKFLQGSTRTVFAPNSGGQPLYVCLNVWWECVDDTELRGLELALQSVQGARVHYGKWHDWAGAFVTSTCVADHVETFNTQLEQEAWRRAGEARPTLELEETVSCH